MPILQSFSEVCISRYNLYLSSKQKEEDIEQKDVITQ